MSDVKGVVPAARVFHRLRQFDGLKRFLLGTGFFLLYFTHQSFRIDWVHGQETHNAYERARKSAGNVPFWQHESFASQMEFMGKDLGRLIPALHASCLNCDLAITHESHDVKDLALRDFDCTDIEMTPGSSYYPARDCEVVDAQFAEKPTPDNVPCCLNMTLIEASYSLKVWHRIKHPAITEPDWLSPGHATLDDLLAMDSMYSAGPPDFGRPELSAEKKEVFSQFREQVVAPFPGFNASQYPMGSALYVLHAIDIKEFIAQIIISREQRMIGLECRAAWLDKKNSPGYVVPRKRYWSYNPMPDQMDEAGYIVLVIFLCFFYIVGVAHEVLAGYSECLTIRELGKWLCQLSYLLFVTVNLLPVLAEMSKPNLKLSDWILFVSCNELLLAIRAFYEGKVLGPLRLVVQTIIYATGNLVNLFVPVTAMSIIIAYVSGQLFGLETTHESTKFIARAPDSNSLGCADHVVLVRALAETHIRELCCRCARWLLQCCASGD